MNRTFKSTVEEYGLNHVKPNLILYILTKYIDAYTKSVQPK